MASSPSTVGTPACSPRGQNSYRGEAAPGEAPGRGSPAVLGDAGSGWGRPSSAPELVGGGGAHRALPPHGSGSLLGNRGNRSHQHQHQELALACIGEASHDGQGGLGRTGGACSLGRIIVDDDRLRGEDVKNV